MLSHSPLWELMTRESLGAGGLRRVFSSISPLKGIGEQLDYRRPRGGSTHTHRTSSPCSPKKPSLVDLIELQHPHLAQISISQSGGAPPLQGHLPFSGLMGTGAAVECAVDAAGGRVVSVWEVVDDSDVVLL